MTDFEDPDKTIVKPLADLRPAPVAPPGSDQGDALPVGTRLGEFQITSLIGNGAFGNVYLARDYSLGRNVALKEYLPYALATRVDGICVAARSARHGADFAAGLISFINEARLLARFDHPSLVKVHRFWEANGTAYMVMPFYEGPTLLQVLREMGAPPSEQWLKHLLAPLLDALQSIHQEDCFHRDIAPDNIVLLPSGRPVLLDFGAVRHVVGDMAGNLKPGYAPPEQYAADASVRQGAWTDLYALAAVVRYAITGEPAAPSVERVVSDTMEPLEQVAGGRYSQGFLQAIDQALALDPEKRPQSVPEMRTLLGLERSAPPPEERLLERELAQPPKTGLRAGVKAVWAGVALAGLAMGAGWLFLASHDTRPAAPTQGLGADSAKASAKPGLPSAPDPAATSPSPPGSQPATAQTELPATPPALSAGQQEPLAVPALQEPAADAQGRSPAPTANRKSAASAPRNNPARIRAAAASNPAIAAKAPVQMEPEPQRATAAPAPAPAPVVEIAAAPQPPRASSNVAASPVDACGKNRAFLSSCVRDRCKWSEFTNHPICVEARAKER